MSEASAIGQPVTSENELVLRARQAVSQCNWVVGECASEWTERYAKGRTDADFARLVELSPDQVFQRRRVWEVFGSSKDEYSELRWSHYYVALNWENAIECLEWANDNGATVAEMRAWRRAQLGEDLGETPAGEAISFLPTDAVMVRDPGDAEETDATPGAPRASSPSDDTRTVESVAREAGDSMSGYAPFRQGATIPPPEEVVESGGAPTSPRSEMTPERALKRMVSSLERYNRILTDDYIVELRQEAASLRYRLVSAATDLLEKVRDIAPDEHPKS